MHINLSSIPGSAGFQGRFARETDMQGSLARAPLASELPDLPIRPGRALAIWLVAAGALWGVIGALSLGLVQLF
jgi:hypothetical protein